MNIAIIGAGICGLRVAQQLPPDIEVTIFEKSRGVGGRLATRYTDDFEFDHGAPFFEAKTDVFKQWLIESLAVREWNARFARFSGQVLTQFWEETVYLGYPKMNQLGKYLAKDMSILFNTRIVRVDNRHGVWYLYDEQDQTYGPFDWLLSTIPWPQAKDLFVDFVEFNYLSMQDTTVYLLGFSQHMNLAWDVAEIEGQKIVHNSAKPGRSKLGSVVVYCPGTREISPAIFTILGDKPIYQQQHYWRYAQAQNSNDAPLIVDQQLKYIITGDWLSSSAGVESSFLIAQQIAQYFLEAR